MLKQAQVSILGLNYPPEPTGISPYTGGLASALRKLGYGVTVHTAHPHYPEWSIAAGYGQWLAIDYADGINVRRRLHYVPRKPRGFRRLLSELTFGLRLLSGRLGRPDVVIAVSPSLFSTALALLRFRLRASKPPVVVWVQDLYTLGLEETGEGGGFAGRLIRWVETRTLRSATRVVVIHPRFAEYVERVLGVEGRKIEVIRNWTHLSELTSTSSEMARDALNWPVDKVLAIHTGNMGAKQALENVVEAARLADVQGAPVHFFLIGDGGERRMLEELAAGISRISFVNPLAEAEYQWALNAADVLIVNEKPGVSGMAVPSKLTSYFHAGRAVVAATDGSGITASEITESGAGVVVPAGSPLELLEAVLYVGSDRELAARLGANGRRFRQRVLDETAATESWARVIEDIEPRR